MMKQSKQVRNNPLVGNWSMAEILTDDQAESSLHVDTYTFCRNGVFKWKQTMDGEIILRESGIYTIGGNKLYVSCLKQNIFEKAVFYIVDNKLFLRFDLWQYPVILTKL